MSTEKVLDVICLGRAAVDLYGQQIGSRLEDMSSLAKYLGGSSCNIACGTSRLGLKSAMLTRVGDEHMGRFVREELSRNGVDVSHVHTDTERLTGLVILGIKDSETFPLIFYRNDCADMALSTEDFNRDFIASAKSVLVTGTHLSTEGTYAASKQAMEYARAAKSKVILDIDYRPVLWGLTGLGEGENRFVSNESVTGHLQSILPLCDLIVGTEEEVHIAGGSTDTITALKNIRAISDATITLKLGPLGCTVLDGAIPDSEESFDVFTGVRVDVLNVLGAGDAFMSGFLRGWLRGESYQNCCAYANACGALVVSRHGCAPAIPSEEELFDYLSRAAEVPRPDLDTRLNYLHRVTNRSLRERNELCILAFDHRKQFYDMAVNAGADPKRIDELKTLLVEATAKGAEIAQLEENVGVLIDDTYGQDALNSVTGRDWWIGRPVELPSSRPLELEGGRDVSARLATWPIEHIVKCLVFYHPEDSVDMRLQQERQVKELYNACMRTGHELLLEVIPPADSEKADDTIVSVMTRMYNLGIFPDWWKLPSPSRNAWQSIDALIKQRAPHCRGVLLLGLDAPMDELQEGLNNSAGFEVCKGFAVGRTITGAPSRLWFAEEIDNDELVRQVVQNYLQLIEAWRSRSA
ncbi:bifunctional 5-dehydro-2-deoxygluconokinase/5-dehydro-2-deoxyphosphogluconate aldolase [Pseudoteredinibacter isoporae]|uniref:5-dehydro-2-deoxygluconokinase n=1 Tax=Pseudoteredinibacter isoporae TaxID=570281 RepID=A0A7X0JUV6_9GAMM|nr:5-dehydro-2-deoxygluconokinase [Pseudoteredinibacter isoporae]MBB6522592.1 5-dehydro-2-deoxygluconokinase [Pseudoteredinibacter isoporae]NHO88122.1 5-dehydro-2-deoxygluconokinase [Pseudoteredinibacter isoporae]NIB23547.1 5-dehydro-2-deoxygluconokinase [Pseudoteredinibacter isoporae]